MEWDAVSIHHPQMPRPWNPRRATPGAPPAQAPLLAPAQPRQQLARAEATLAQLETVAWEYGITPEQLYTPLGGTPVLLPETLAVAAWQSPRRMARYPSHRRETAAA